MNTPIHNVEQSIVKIQRSLNEIMYAGLIEDGVFGESTKRSLQDWQLAHGYEPDGLYRGRTKEVLDKYIDTRDLKEKDFIDAALELKCPVSHIKAVTKIESKGSGFLISGRNVILFERHIFFNQLNKSLKTNSDLLLKLCQKFNIVEKTLEKLQQYLITNYSNIYNPKPGGYIGTTNGIEHEWNRYSAAESIDRHSAAMSASYGLFQIMGFNYHAIIGYNTVDEMIDSFAESERNQLLGFCHFVKANPRMHSALKKGEWTTFATLYNGPEQSKNQYDKKLQEAVVCFT